MTEQLFAGFDIGGTHTRFFIQHQNGDVISSGKRDGLNYASVSRDDFITFIKTLFSDVLEASSAYTIVCGVAGLVNKSDVEFLSNEFSNQW